jgi:glycosyltransferase involved in cell wall biosynthesis
MKILLVNYLETTSPGGINKVIRELAINLSTIGHDVTVLQPNPSKQESTESLSGFNIIRVSSRFDKYFYGLNYEMYRYLKKHLKELNPDVIHVHGYHSLLPIETIYTIKRIDPEIPIIFSPHLDIIKSTFAGKYLWNIYNLFARRVFKKSKYIISDSNFEAKNIEYIGVGKEKISVINPGVDTFEHIDKTRKIEKNSKENKIKLLYTGYLISRKGVDFILNSLNILVNDIGFKEVVLTIVGDGPYKQDLLKLSENLKLEDYIVWKSFLPREDLINEIINSDIFMLLSRSEAYGITVTEALTLKTPCIITNRTALKEFKDEPGCFIVDYPPKPKIIAELILDINKDDITVGPLTSKIRPWNEVIRDYERLYKSALSN